MSRVVVIIVDCGASCYENKWGDCSEWYLLETGLQRRPKQSWDAMTQSAPISLTYPLIVLLLIGDLP